MDQSRIDDDERLPKFARLRHNDEESEDAKQDFDTTSSSGEPVEDETESDDSDLRGVEMRSDSEGSEDSDETDLTDYTVQPQSCKIY